MLGLLKSDEYAGFVRFSSAADEKFDPQESFAAACAAAHKGGPPFRQTTSRDFIKTRDSGGNFFQYQTGKIVVRRPGMHDKSPSILHLICSRPLVVGRELYFKDFLRRVPRECNKKSAGYPNSLRWISGDQQSH